MNCFTGKAAEVANEVVSLSIRYLTEIHYFWWVILHFQMGVNKFKRSTISGTLNASTNMKDADDYAPVPLSGGEDLSVEMAIKLKQLTFGGKIQHSVFTFDWFQIKYFRLSV